MDKKQIKYSLKTFKIGRGSCAKGVKNELPSYLRTMEHKILKKVKSNPTLSPLEFFSPQPRNVEPESAGSNPRRYNSDALGMQNMILSSYSERHLPCLFKSTSSKHKPFSAKHFIQTKCVKTGPGMTSRDVKQDTQTKCDSVANGTISQHGLKHDSTLQTIYARTALILKDYEQKEIDWQKQRKGLICELETCKAKLNSKVQESMTSTVKGKIKQKYPSYISK